MDGDEWDTSLVRRRAPRIGYSYPSHQTRNGPAPLASFEDLPSEDQTSPNSPSKSALADLNAGTDVIDEALACDSRNMFCDRSDSATPVNDLSPVDERNASVATLTQLPDTALKSSCLITDTGLSYNRRKSSPIPGKQSLCTGQTAKSLTPDSKRKGSWTDVLFRGRSRSRSPVDDVLPADANQVTTGEDKKKKRGVFSFLKKKSSKTDHRKDQSMPDGPAKTGTGVQRPQYLETPDIAFPQSKGSPEDRRIAWETLRLPRLSITEPSTDGNTSATDSMHNEPLDLTPDRDSELDELQMLDAAPNPVLRGGSPVDRKLAWELLHEQMKIGEPAEPEHQPNEAPLEESPVPKRSFPLRKLKHRTDTVDSEISECQSLPEILPSARKPKRDTSSNNNESATVTIQQESEDLVSDDDESSSNSSGLSADKKSFMGRVVTSADDNEVANLLSHVDSNDADEHSICDSPSSRSSSQQRQTLLPDRSLPDATKQTSVQILSKKERQDLTIIPVDRPRSTTPANVATLEEYLRRASLSPERVAAERFKLSLPGDQFTTCLRSKDQRKSNPQIWLDFCGKAVGSPRSKKTFNWSELVDDSKDGIPSPQNVLLVATPISPNDAFSPSDTPLTPVTPLDDHKWNAFNDSFDPSNYLLTQGLVIPSECNKCMCKLKRKGVFASTSPGSSTDESPLMEKFADPTALEHQVLLPPKTLPSSVDSLPTVSRTQRAEEDSDCEQEPLMSPNGCECNCHSGVGFNLMHTSNVQQQQNPPAPPSSFPPLHKQDSELSASSEISSASSRVMDSSSSGKLSLDDPAHEGPSAPGHDPPVAESLTQRDV